MFVRLYHRMGGRSDHRFAGALFLDPQLRRPKACHTAAFNRVRRSRYNVPIAEMPSLPPETGAQGGPAPRARVARARAPIHQAQANALRAPVERSQSGRLRRAVRRRVRETLQAAPKTCESQGLMCPARAKLGFLEWRRRAKATSRTSRPIGTAWKVEDS